MATEVSMVSNAGAGPNQQGQNPTVVATPPHLHTYNTNPATITWERLETMRLQQLGLSNKYSRHFNVLRQSMPASRAPVEDRLALGGISREYALNVVTASYGGQSDTAMGLTRARTSRGRLDAGAIKKVNSLAPFATLGKPTCGVFFSRETDNRKVKFGIPPSDLVKWRHFGSQQN